MKKFSDKINETKEDSAIITLNSMDNDLLNERLDYLRMEIKEISDEIQSIVSILKSRSDDSFREKLKTFPESIFDMNKEQLDFILINDNSSTTYQHKERSKYWNQLKGFFQTGSDGEKASFSISMAHFEERHYGNFQIPDGFEESFALLLDCLKKDGKTKFSILCQYSDSYDKKMIIEDDVITLYWDYTPKKYKLSDINQVVKYIYEIDMEDSDYDN